VSHLFHQHGLGIFGRIQNIIVILVNKKMQELPFEHASDLKFERVIVGFPPADVMDDTRTIECFGEDNNCQNIT